MTSGQFSPENPVLVCGIVGGKITEDGQGIQRFEDFAAAKEAFPDLDPMLGTERFTWAMADRIGDRPATRFETWELHRLLTD